MFNLIKTKLLEIHETLYTIIDYLRKVMKEDSRKGSGNKIYNCFEFC